MKAAQSYIATVEEQLRSLRPEIGWFSILILAFNCHLLFPVDSLHFQTHFVESGEWWRIFTFPFVHISFFHLALDASAFLLLYNSLEEKRCVNRLLYIAVCSFASLLLTYVTTNQINSLGLCGLSGIAHGLMAVSALEMIHSKLSDGSRKMAGLFVLGIVVGKSIYEAATGHVIFERLYFGLVGTPLVMTHMGGIAGGMGAFYLIKLVKSVIYPYMHGRY